MILSPFQPLGNSWIINTSGTANTSQSTLILLTGSTNAGLGAGMQPNIMRVFNKGSSDVWVDWTQTTGTATIPTAGTTTMGTPQPTTFIEPGVDLIFTIPVTWTVVTAQIQGNVGQLSFYMNTISTGISQPLYCQFGEGM
jgi:hypothetical protein